ncbi:hypothetical protein [Crossiella sp. CA198]|uniref:hypothetical protein n=1 Tax=Crossiella sp. CA198 TaxID=3455607 RepID=UPI003F8D88DA
MRKLALTAVGLTVLAVTAPVASAAPALQYDIAMASNVTEIQAYNGEAFNFELTVTNLGTEAGSVGAVHAPRIKGLKLTATGEGWDCVPEPAESWSFFCMNQVNLEHGQSLPKIRVSGVTDGSTSHTFIPVTADGHRRSEQNHTNNVVNIQVTSYDH